MDDHLCVGEVVKLLNDDGDSPPWTIEMFFKNRYDEETGDYSLPPRIPISTYISPSGESILLMAEKAHNDFLVDLYLLSVENPIMVNTKTGESIFDLAREVSKKKYDLYDQYIVKTIPVKSELRCPVCLEDWDEFDDEGNLIGNDEDVSLEERFLNGKSGDPGQRLEFLCKPVGHVFHNRCIEQLSTARGCPICSASIRPKYYPRRKVDKAEIEQEYKKELSGEEIEMETSLNRKKEDEKEPESEIHNGGKVF